jgi:hypothetical protein
VNALESSRVVVSGLAAVRDELVADVPLGIQRDAPRQLRLLVGISHVAPEDRLDLRSCWSSGDDECLACGCASIHQSASLDIVCDLETSCDALKAL